MCSNFARSFALFCHTFEFAQETVAVAVAVAGGGLLKVVQHRIGGERLPGGI